MIERVLLSTGAWMVELGGEQPQDAVTRLVVGDSSASICHRDLSVLSTGEDRVHLFLRAHATMVGSPPVFALFSDRNELLVGVDTTVYVVDLLARLVVAELDIGYAISHFGRWPAIVPTVVFHELGVAALGDDVDGPRILWCHTMDVVREISMNGGRLCLRDERGERLLIDVETGAMVP